MTPDMAGSLLQYGALGVLVLVALGAARVLYKQVTENAAKDRERADRLEQELRQQNAMFAEKALPAIVQATAVITAAMEIIRHGKGRQ